jgi:hypothetical protein
LKSGNQEPASHATTPAAVHRSRIRTGVLFVLAAVATLALLIRIPSIAEPLGVDQCFWASAARGLSRGQMLYVDVWDHKPPATTLAYFAAFSLFGWTAASIAWADILASAATALLLFAIVRRTGGVAMATIAAALYTTLTVPTWLYRHGGISERAVAETFIVVLVALAAWCATHLVTPGSPASRDGAPRQRSTTTFAVVIGACAGAAIMFKPNAGVHFLALVLWVALYRRTADLNLFRIVVIVALASCVLPAAMLAWLWSRGALPQAWVALVDFNRMYVSQGLTFRGYALDFAKTVWLRMKTDPLWVAGGIGTLVAGWDLLRSRRLDAVCALAIAWGGAAALAIVANGVRLYNTYFIQALAPLAVLAAWLFAGVARRALVGRLAASIAAVLMVLLLVGRHYPAKVYEFARSDLDQVLGRSDRRAYLQNFGGYANARGYSAWANEELAAFVRAHTGRDDLIYLFGIDGAGIYFAADRLTAHRFLRVNFYVGEDFPDSRVRLASVTRELAVKRPAYLIFERLYSPPVFRDATERLLRQPDVVRLLESYRFETQIEDFALYRRVN